MKTLILGLGNPLLGDDGVGLHAAMRLRSMISDFPHVEVGEDYWGGLRLMERMIGYDRAIIIDAICTGSEPGTIHQLTPEDIPTQRSASAHDVNLSTALRLGHQAGAHLPTDERISLIGIEAGDVSTFSETLTPAVEAVLQKVTELILSMLTQERETP
jgi:hydrogenase maturation protease